MAKLYTLSELEPILGLSHVTLRTYVKQGKLKGTKLAGTGKWKVSEDDLRDFITEYNPDIKITLDSPKPTPEPKPVLDKSKAELKNMIDLLTPEQAKDLLNQITGR